MTVGHLNELTKMIKKFCSRDDEIIIMDYDESAPNFGCINIWKDLDNGIVSSFTWDNNEKRFIHEDYEVPEHERNHN